MTRTPTLTDEEIVARARPVFVDHGFSARTREIAAAVGLSWGAIALRFGTKRELFTEAMCGQPSSGEKALGRLSAADLPSLLQRLRAHVWERWPLRLQLRLAAASPRAGREEEALAQELADALASHARRGEVRCDLAPQELARMVLALVTGDVAQRFVAHERGLPDAPGFLQGVVRLLSPA